MVELYLHSLIFLHGIILKFIIKYWENVIDPNIYGKWWVSCGPCIGCKCEELSMEKP
jgi:hypothetical protein